MSMFRSPPKEHLPFNPDNLENTQEFKKLVAYAEKKGKVTSKKINMTNVQKYFLARSTITFIQSHKNSLQDILTALEAAHDLNAAIENRKKQNSNEQYDSCNLETIHLISQKSEPSLNNVFNTKQKEKQAEQTTASESKDSIKKIDMTASGTFTKSTLSNIIVGLHNLIREAAIQKAPAAGLHAAAPGRSK